MAGSLTDPFAKLGRAIKHYRFLKEEFHGGFDRQYRPVVAERHPDGLEYRFRVQGIEPLLPEWSLIYGDAFHNVRASLDHLAYQLHVRHYRGQHRVPPDAEKDSAFPILIERRMDSPTRPKPTKGWGEIRRLSKAVRTSVEWLQPYQTRQDELRGIRKALADIALIDNIDKHRQLHPAIRAAASVAQPHFPPALGFQQHPVFGVALEPNAYVDRWTFTQAPDPAQVPVHAGVYTVVSIEPAPGDRLEALAHLGGCILAAGMALDRFRRYFPATPMLDLSHVRERIEPWPRGR